MEKKFDVVIGNPPYQEDSVGESTHNMPIYDKFMEAAYEVGSRVVLITPARFLFNAGYTDKVWNRKMLNDQHLSVSHYVPNSNMLFPGTDIKGGIAVTYWDEASEGEPIGTFTRYPDLNSILHKVDSSGGKSLTDIGITNDRQHRYTDKMHEDTPTARSLMSQGNPYKIDAGAFDRMPFVFHVEKPSDGHDYVGVLGLAKRKRAMRWIRSDYVSGPQSLSAYKVAVPAANGSGELGEVLSSPVVIGPDIAVTGTFLTIGSFGRESEAKALLKYLKSKFARALLGVLKVTQHNAAHTWKHVPLQDFTQHSDIDWSTSIAEIDQQLYTKYGLEKAEVEFIQSYVKPMT